MIVGRAIFSLFFLSGAAGLVYQVLWLRRLALVFGVTVYAASTVLAAFMAGLAIGSLIAGRVFGMGRALGLVDAEIEGVTNDAESGLFEGCGQRNKQWRRRSSPRRESR